jgi:hypothetical protein
MAGDQMFKTRETKLKMMAAMNHKKVVAKTKVVL